MKFELITLSGVKLDQAIYSAIIPTIDGEISVFPSHEPLVTLATLSAYLSTKPTMVTRSSKPRLRLR